MRKSLVFGVVSLALFGFMQSSYAGVVSTNSDTNISISGFIQTYFDWANNQTNLGYVANPKYTKAGTLNTPAQTALGTSTQFSRIRFGLSNPSEGITGNISGDFFGAAPTGKGQQLYDKGNFRLRQAYIVKSFCQEGCNYTPWLLIGQTSDPLKNPGNFTLNTILGIAGQNWGKGAVRTSQIGFGIKFDLGSVKLNPAIYAANLAGNSYFGNSGALYPTTISVTGSTSKVVSYTNGVPTVESSSTLNPITTYSQLSYRMVSPGFATKIPAEFNTGLGAPASAYAGFEWQPMKVTANKGQQFTVNGKQVTIDSNNENAWMMTVGLILPVYFVNLTGNFHYERGMTAFDEPLFDKQYTMPSFYVDENGSVQAVRGTTWTAQAQIDFNKLAQVPLTVAGGYGQTVFSNYGELGNNAVNTTVPLVRKMGTIFVNANYHLTKSLALGLEYDRNKTYYVGAGNDGSSGQNSNQVFLRGMYTF